MNRVSFDRCVLAPFFLGTVGRSLPPPSAATTHAAAASRRATLCCSLPAACFCRVHRRCRGRWEVSSSFGAAPGRVFSFVLFTKIVQGRPRSVQGCQRSKGVYGSKTYKTSLQASVARGGGDGGSRRRLRRLLCPWAPCFVCGASSVTVVAQRVNNPTNQRPNQLTNQTT